MLTFQSRPLSSYREFTAYKMNVFHSLSRKVSSFAFPSRSKTKTINGGLCNSHCLRKWVNSGTPNGSRTKFAHNSLEPTKTWFLCGRRYFLESAGMATSTFPIRPSNAVNSDSEYKAIIKKFHPPRGNWYEEFFARCQNSKKDCYYCPKVENYMSQIFNQLKRKAQRSKKKRGNPQKILEIGIGPGANFRYYANNYGVQVVGIDPNQKMEKYARLSAESAGLPLSRFQFIHAVAEAIPLSDASVDVVLGTIVLCSVKDVDLTLKEVKRVLRPGGPYIFIEHVATTDRPVIRLMQKLLNPLSQAIGDGCHLYRETGNNISKSGFSSVNLNVLYASEFQLSNPIIYGVAYK